MAQKDLIPLNLRTKEEQQAITIAGGKASGVARRAKRDLKARLELGLEFLTTKEAKKLKKKGKLADAELLKEIGLEVYSLLEIANNAKLDKKVTLAALNDIMDRIEGKPVQKNILDATVNETQELSDKEKDLINRQIEKQAKKLKND